VENVASVVREPSVLPAMRAAANRLDMLAEPRHPGEWIRMEASIGVILDKPLDLSGMF
jgi:hypothetical protein